MCICLLANDLRPPLQWNVTWMKKSRDEGTNVPPLSIRGHSRVWRVVSGKYGFWSQITLDLFEIELRSHTHTHTHSYIKIYLAYLNTVRFFHYSVFLSNFLKNFILILILLEYSWFTMLWNFLILDFYLDMAFFSRR